MGQKDDLEQEGRFAALLATLATSAMQGLGRFPDPAGGRAEVSLETARLSIDMIEMLARKTRGNLSPDEERMLRDTLASLQMTYVKVAEAASETGAAGGKEAEPPAAEPESGPEPPASPEAGGAKHEAARFRKSYG